jgi:hypothetical protein
VRGGGETGIGTGVARVTLEVGRVSKIPGCVAAGASIVADVVATPSVVCASLFVMVL